MTRLLYRLLLCLHPPAFRRQFGEEMLWIFDESREQQAALPLLTDALASLARQWLFRTSMVRTTIWIPITACVGALVPLAAGISIGRIMKHQIHPDLPVVRTLNIEFLELSAITAVIAISCTVILCVVWFRFSRRRHA
jgi:hypothetical protein